MAGINASQVQGDDYTGFNKLGLSGGAFIDIRNPDNYWGIRLEMHYAEKAVVAAEIPRWAPPPSNSG